MHVLASVPWYAWVRVFNRKLNDADGDIRKPKAEDASPIAKMKSPRLLALAGTRFDSELTPLGDRMRRNRVFANSTAARGKFVSHPPLETQPSDPTLRRMTTSAREVAGDEIIIQGLATASRNPSGKPGSA